MAVTERTEELAEIRQLLPNFGVFFPLKVSGPHFYSFPITVLFDANLSV